MNLRGRHYLVVVCALLCGCGPPVDQSEVLKYISGSNRVTIVVEDMNGVHPPIVLDTRDKVHQFVCGIGSV